MHPYYFCNNFVKPNNIFKIFWHINTLVNLQQNATKLTTSPNGCSHPTL